MTGDPNTLETALSRPTAAGSPPNRFRGISARLPRVVDEHQSSKTDGFPESAGVESIDSTLIPGWVPPELDTTKAHTARIYEYLLGGMHYFDVDREAGETALRHVPQAREILQENRAFQNRATRFLIASGITQFLDLGSGLPGTGNIGDVARAEHRQARIVFVDFDPMVAVHGRALVAAADPAHTAVVEADVRRPAEVLADPELRRVLDLEQPVAIVMTSLLQFFAPEEDPRGIVAEYLAAVPPGSALVVSHITDGGRPAQAEAAVRAWDQTTSQMYMRGREEIAALFAGTELVEPGVVPRPLWRPDGEPRADWEEIWGLAGVGIKR
ncbi:SAM-dependent methyltransferase [Catenulispora sp. NF23]|uniref:SAM-dependent methyltransferase n=1 Tax=Catenulispora pinistramenti TaxID=2705254 RepID=A0ABS5KX02_9ACTN|nr:SAM-dependent methyltransferase [Catenulispora pinistramenti]MBS2550514.1 SAM-dependent methyltransferase [Catenulispora pinistramenti]